MSKHERGILERRPGVWYARYRDAKGRDRWKKAGSKTSAIMLYQKLSAQALRDKLFPELAEKPVIAFSEIASDCLKWSEFNKQSWRTDRSKMKRLVAQFGNFSANGITPVEIESLKSKLQGDGLKNATINRHLALLSLTFKLAIRAGKVSDNPVSRVQKMREDSGRTRFLSDEEERSLREIITSRFPHHIPELDIAIHTGMRQSEQYKLQWAQVDLERGVLFLRKTKNGNPRHIRLNSVAREAFAQLSKSSKNRKDGRVFPIKSPRGWFESAVARAKIQGFVYHDLRHTFGSRLSMAGVPIQHIKELMGHKTLAMTMRYAHLSPDFQSDTVEKLVKRKGKR